MDRDNTNWLKLVSSLAKTEPKHKTHLKLIDTLQLFGLTLSGCGFQQDLTRLQKEGCRSSPRLAFFIRVPFFNYRDWEALGKIFGIVCQSKRPLPTRNSKRISSPFEPLKEPSPWVLHIGKLNDNVDKPILSKGNHNFKGSLLHIGQLY